MLRAISSPLFPPETFILIGITVFVALSLLASLFDRVFPAAVPYVYQIAALAGFGIIWANYAFCFFEHRFWYSIAYLVLAQINVLATAFYVAIKKRLLTAAFALLCGATVSAFLISFVYVIAYLNGSAVWIPPFPIVPLECFPIALVVCIVILGLSVVVYFEPQELKKTFGRLQRKPPSYAAGPSDGSEEKRAEKEVKNE